MFRNFDISVFMFSHFMRLSGHLTFLGTTSWQQKKQDNKNKHQLFHDLLPLRLLKTKTIYQKQDYFITGLIFKININNSWR